MTNKLKKLIAILLILSVSFMYAGCKSETKEEKPEKNNLPESTIVDFKEAPIMWDFLNSYTGYKGEIDPNMGGSLFIICNQDSQLDEIIGNISVEYAVAPETLPYVTTSYITIDYNENEWQVMKKLFKEWPDSLVKKEGEYSFYYLRVNPIEGIDDKFIFNDANEWHKINKEEMYALKYPVNENGNGWPTSFLRKKDYQDIVKDVWGVPIDSMFFDSFNLYQEFVIDDQYTITVIDYELFRLEYSDTTNKPVVLSMIEAGPIIQDGENEDAKHKLQEYMDNLD